MNLAENEQLKQIIFARLQELDMTHAELMKDASERGYELNRSRYSKWKKGQPGALNDENIIWIMERLGIAYNVNFGVPTIKEGKLNWIIPKFEMLTALRRLNILFKKPNR